MNQCRCGQDIQATHVHLDDVRGDLTHNSIERGVRYALEMPPLGDSATTGVTIDGVRVRRFVNGEET